MEKLFSNQKVNTGRQVELDLAKCLAIFFMIFLHCYFVQAGFNNTISEPMSKIIGHLLGGPFAAPVFMFSMGVGMVYSRNQEPGYMITRGIKLMLLGVVVNVGEFILPHFLAGKLLGEWDIFPIAGGLLLFCIDILAFAGMAFILIGLLRKLKLSAKQIVIVAIVLSVAGSFLRLTDFGSNVSNLIAGYFIGSAGGFTAFPLFNWFIFPAAGLVFGEYYIRCNNKKKLLSLWPLGLLISLAYFITSWFLPKGFLSETHMYYFLTTIDVVFCLICIYGVIGLCYVITGLLSDSAKQFIMRTSGNVNAIYVVQWFLIPLTYIFVTFFNRDIVYGDPALVILGLIEFAAATGIAAVYKKFKKNQGKG